MAVKSVVIGGDGVPDEPNWRLIYQNEDDLQIASIEWGKVIREMREAETLTVANGHAIRRLVDFRIQYERASRHVAENGAVFAPKRKNSKCGQHNPWAAVMRSSSEEIRYLETELGISPIRRGRASKVQKRAKEARAADAYLKRA